VNYKLQLDLVEVQRLQDNQLEQKRLQLLFYQINNSENNSDIDYLALLQTFITKQETEINGLQQELISVQSNIVNEQQPARLYTENARINKENMLLTSDKLSDASHKVNEDPSRQGLLDAIHREKQLNTELTSQFETLTQSNSRMEQELNLERQNLRNKRIEYNGRQRAQVESTQHNAGCLQNLQLLNEKLLSNMRFHVSCNFCYEAMQESVTTYPCKHSVCKKCIQLVQSGEEMAGSCICFACRADNNSNQQCLAVQNNFLNSLIAQYNKAAAITAQISKGSFGPLS
jgi:hypothetical protein